MKDSTISVVVLRTDISKKATGFSNKKFLNKHIGDVQKKFNLTANRKLKHHSIMDDGRHVYHGIDHDRHHHYMVTGSDNTVHASITAIKHGKSHMIDMAVGKSGAGIHKLYHHLITKHNHILTSKEQSYGGLSIWQKIRKMGGVNVHGYYPKSGKPQHIDIVRYPEDSHVSQKELDKQRKSKGGTISQRKKEYADLKKTQGMMVVAHKNRNIRPMKPIKESAADIVLRIIREKVL